MILHDDILKVAQFGGINIHGALLPQYRGCNPTQWAVLNGETVTGVTLHEMTTGLDEGAIIDQKTVPIYFEDTWRTIQLRIAKATDQLISVNLSIIISGQWQSKPQESELAHYYRRRTPEDGLFYWNQPVYEIYNLIRVLVAPYPGAFYLDENNEKVAIEHYMTPTAVTALKYGDVGDMVMQCNQLRLRPLHLKDIELLSKWDIDCEHITFNSFNRSISEAKDEVWFESILFKQTDLVIFMIEDIASECMIGTCQLLNINWSFQSAELQIRISQTNSRGKGIVYEVIKLLCEFGFKDLNLHRIYLYSFFTNENFIKECAKNKFIREGVLLKAAYINNEFVDIICMSLLKNEYE